MQGLYSKTHANPLEVQYYSCVAYLLGTGQAMQYTIKPRSPQKTRVPKQPSANYLREAMAGTLSKQAVAFDFMIQLQTDPYGMPIEDASVRWPERISPIVPVARLHIPAQKFYIRRVSSPSQETWPSTPGIVSQRIAHSAIRTGHVKRFTLSCRGCASR